MLIFEHPLQLQLNLNVTTNRNVLRALALPLQGRPPPRLTIFRPSLTVSFSPLPVGMAGNGKFCYV